MQEDLKKRIGEIQNTFAVNLSFLKVLRSYCQDETKNGSEIKDIIIALNEIIPRQEEGINLLAEIFETK